MDNYSTDNMIHGNYIIRGFIGGKYDPAAKKDLCIDPKNNHILIPADELGYAMITMMNSKHSGEPGMACFRSDLTHIATEQAMIRKICQDECDEVSRLYDLIHVQKKNGTKYPTSLKDYDSYIDFDKLPEGVKIGFAASDDGEISWGKVPPESQLFC